jgi:trans-aconitate 2-methyltransferase
MTHQWSPDQYVKFERERQKPFFDLLQLIHPYEHMRIVDVGCGEGKLTKFLHNELKATYTLGIDSSMDMLAKSEQEPLQQVDFKQMDMQVFETDHLFDLVISNAALQWVPDHFSLFNRLTRLLARRGQLAIQIPYNQDYPTHKIAKELAEEPFFQPFFQTLPLPFASVLKMEAYVALLKELGFTDLIVRTQAYGHELDSTASIIEWVKGSLLTYYQSYLPSEVYALFFQIYQKRLLESLGEHKPFLFIMKRLFIWGQKVE